MNSKYKIRLFQPHDQDKVYTLVLSIMENEFKELPPENFLSDLKDITSSYSGNNNAFFVCEENDNIIGTIALKFDDDNVGLLRRFFVNPHYRGKKIGKRLLDGVYDFARKVGYKKLVFTGNNRMQKVKSLLLKNDFQEKEDIVLKSFEIFKLEHLIKE